MATHRAGFTLLDVMFALVVLTVGLTLLARLTVTTSQAAARGRRWTLMATAAEAELTRLERDYRQAAPNCVPPLSASRTTPDGVDLDWSVRPDSARVEVVLEVRGMAAGRRLIDTIVTGFPCR